MITSPHPRLVQFLCAAALAIGAAGEAVADACDGNDVMQILSTAETSAAYVQCEAKGVASAFHQSAGGLVENLGLLYDFSRDPAIPRDPTLPVAAADARSELVQLKASLHALDGVDWAAASATALAGEQMTQGIEIVNRLTAPLTPIQSGDVAASHRNSFCEVRLNWKLANLWFDRSNECNSCTQNCPP